MSNVSYNLALHILKEWGGTPLQNWQQWDASYDWVVPPPPPASLVSNEALAQYIADNYGGPVITG